MCVTRRPANAGCGVERRSGRGQADSGAAIVGPREHGIDSFTGNFRVNLDQRAGKPVNVVQVVVGPTGFVGAPERAIVDYIRAIYVDRAPPDLIVTPPAPRLYSRASIGGSFSRGRRCCSLRWISDTSKVRHLGRTRLRSRPPTIFLACR